MKPPKPPTNIPSLQTAPRVSAPRPARPVVTTRPPALAAPPVPHRVADAAGDAPSVRAAAAGDVRPRPAATGAVPEPPSTASRMKNFHKSHPRLAAAGIVAGGVFLYAQATGQGFGEAASDLSSRSVEEAATLAGSPLGGAAAGVAADIAEGLGIDLEQVWLYMRIAGAGAAVFGGLWALSTARTAIGI